MFKVFSFLAASLIASACLGHERVQVRGTMETVAYGGQRKDVDLSVGDVLKIDFGSLPQDQIRQIEIVHSRQRLQVGRYLTDSRANDDGERPVGSIETSLFFSTIQSGNETLFVRAIRESGPDENWRQIDLKIRPSTPSPSTSTTAARPAR